MEKTKCTENVEKEAEKSWKQSYELISLKCGRSWLPSLPPPPSRPLRFRMQISKSFASWKCAVQCETIANPIHKISYLLCNSSFMCANKCRCTRARTHTLTLKWFIQFILIDVYIQINAWQAADTWIKKIYYVLCMRSVYSIMSYCMATTQLSSSYHLNESSWPASVPKFFSAK